MSKKSDISSEDLEIFHQATKGTKPLHFNKKISLTTKTKSPVVHKPHKHDEHTIELTEIKNYPLVTGEELISFKQSGISNKTLRKLRKGQYNVDATLDLHGLSVEKAKNEVESFLQHCLQNRMRVVLIIHGKGHHSHQPILKNKLNQWLRETNMILAFCSAGTFHGNRGAIYVLLKNVAEENEIG